MVNLFVVLWARWRRYGPVFDFPLLGAYRERFPPAAGGGTNHDFRVGVAEARDFFTSLMVMNNSLGSSIDDSKRNRL